MPTLGRNRLRQVLTTALRVWLVLALWPTPLPWLHEHSTTNEDRIRLVAHQKRFHAVSDVPSGWHLHFDYLWRLAAGPLSEQENNQGTPPNELPATRVSPSTMSQLASPFSTGEWITCVSSVSRVSFGHLHHVEETRRIVPIDFLGSYSDSLAPHQLLGVLLC